MTDQDGSRERPAKVRWRGRDWAQTAQRRFDRTVIGDLTSVVVEAIADAEGVAPHAVTDPTLFECVDIEAVAQLIGDRSTDATGTESVRFDYDGTLIEVSANGNVSVFAPVNDAL